MISKAKWVHLAYLENSVALLPKTYLTGNGEPLPSSMNSKFSSYCISSVKKMYKIALRPWTPSCFPAASKAKIHPLHGACNCEEGS